ncbi:hypothetical protein M446_3361 [Methylobacterium sp. 4-46]|uniref:DUF992 domain-containing protein n=1 Tax=unclassified Methylobacterium TaxID=2615210 RepID=UPI000152D764|nr:MULTISPECIES: DUF992 domain-containing protein [Methylobacterium]ACA17758.1 hypothetical protein M446_3361 [Methylobacterium sp. 4-46]WFT83426.1 DUF992 domain-containing protein [Methylobacterium nodulans]
MRSIAIALAAGALAAGAAYAHSSLSSAALQQAGTLTCTTQPNVTLVFGRTPVAECTFVADRGGFKQTYMAMFSPVRRKGDLSTAETMTWRVMTKDGYSRPSMLTGAFAAQADRPEIISSGESTSLKRGPISLKLVSHSGQRVINFALNNPQVAFAASTESLTR